MSFTIRELLLAITIVAIALGWWVDRSLLYEVASTPTEIWRKRAEAMALLLRDEGWKVTWSGNYMNVKRGEVNARVTGRWETTFNFGNDDNDLRDDSN